MYLSHFSNINQFLCTISGHKFKLIKKVTKHIKYYQCSSCGCQVSTNSKGDLVSLTEELKVIHTGIETVIIKRKSRRLTKKKALA